MTADEIRAKLLCGSRMEELPLRVTFYGRVSTDADRQLDSLSHQSAYFERKIRDCPQWTYVPGYLDEGITGTRADKRPAFLRMVRDAKAGLFDLILTKEVSRFARDIVDCVQTVRELLRYGVGVLIEDIRLNTMESDAEFRLSVMAIVAQEESRKTSERVKFGYRQTMRDGKRHGAAPPIGYLFREDNNGYWIDESRRDAVEYVFSEYAKGEKGMRTLSSELAARGVFGSTGQPFHPSTLERMIRNPVYRGFIVNGKTYKPSYREDRKIAKPRKDWLLHFDPARVPPLVSDALWTAANRILDARGSRMNGIDCSCVGAFGNGKYPYSARILCAEHGCAYHRAVSRWTVGGEERRRELWRCAMYKTHGRKGCDAPILYKDALDSIMRELFSALIPLLKACCDRLEEALNVVLSGRERMNGSEQERRQLEQKRKKLLDGWLNGVLSDTDCRTAVDQIERKLMRLQRPACDEPYTDAIAKIMRQAKVNASLQSPEMLDVLVRSLIREIRIRRDGVAYRMEICLRLADSPIEWDLPVRKRPAHTASDPRRLSCIPAPDPI